MQRDEYLHLDQAKHLAWGYISVPPVTSWLSWIILKLGNGVFWVKFFPALFGALTLWVVWKTIDLFEGGWFALILGSVGLLFSVLLRINILFQPNSLDILCWTLVYYSFACYIHFQNPKWLWMSTFMLAVGFMNKYNIVFLLMGFAPAILLTEHRKIFLQKDLYLALGFALLLISPNLVWQYQNHFPVIYHMKELAETQLVNVNWVDFLKEQLLFFFGSIPVLIFAFVGFFRFAPLRPYRVFAPAYLITILIFTWFKAKGYYAIGLYPILLSFGSVYAENLLKEGWLLFMKPVLILLPIGLFLLVLNSAFPVIGPEEIVAKSTLSKSLKLHRWEDGKDHALPQDFADMLGWRELAEEVDSVFQKLDKNHTLVLCDNYGEAGAINYYSKSKGMAAVSLNADYINWFPLQEMEIRHVILVQEKSDTDTLRTRERALFQSVIKTGQIKNPYAREFGTKIYLLKNAKTSINQILEKEIDKKKKADY